MALTGNRVWTLIQPLLDFIEERTVRERILLLGAGAALIVAVWYYQFFVPVQQNLSQSHSSLEQVEAQLGKLKRTRQRLEAETTQDPDARLRGEIAELHNELERIQEEIGAEVPSFIPPQMMRQVLEEILAERPGARLVNLQRIPAQPVIKGGDSDSADSPQVYRHAIELVIEADFPSTIDYLHELEALPWQFAWDLLDYQVVDYPWALIRLQMHTLSGHRRWLGL